MSLAESLGTLTIEAATLIGDLQDPTLPIDQMGDLTLELEELLRAVAIGVLLTKGRSDPFAHNLVRAGRAWKRFLARCRAEQAMDDHNFCAGLHAPLIDAVAARDWDLAAELGALAPAHFRDGHEHPDDYAFARALQGLLPTTPDSSGVSPHLKECEAAGDQEGAARAALGHALLERDQDAFDAAFDAILASRRAAIAADIESGQIESPGNLAQRKVFVEGIALLNLADRHGLITMSDYSMCPSLARVPVTAPLVGD